MSNEDIFRIKVAISWLTTFEKSSYYTNESHMFSGAFMNSVVTWREKERLVKA